jgi:prolyl oligopeptidase
VARSEAGLVVSLVVLLTSSLTPGPGRATGARRSAVPEETAGKVKPAGAAAAPEAAGPPAPPPTRAAAVAETLHGVEVADPYRWLEDGDSAEVRAWVEAQNAHTRALLDARPGRETTRARLGRLLAIGTLGTPAVRGERLFYTRRDEGQDQPVLRVREGARGEDRALVDPNRLSADGTVALDWWYPSEDGALLAYGVSESGDEKSTLRVLKVATGEHLPDVIPHTRYCSLAWLPDGSGFYYTRYPAPGQVPEGEENYHRHVFFHRLGDDPARDGKIYGQERKPQDMIEISTSPEGRWLLLAVHEGWSRSDLYAMDLQAEGRPLVTVAQGIDALFGGEILGDTLYLLTNHEAPRYRLFAVDLRRPERVRWRLLIPQSDAVLTQVAHAAGGRMIAHYLKDASSRIRVHRADGSLEKEIRLPALGTVAGVSGRHDARHAFWGFSSFTVPPAVYRYDTTGGKVALWEQVKSGVDLSRLEVRQVFYPSRDGTRVSMFLVHRKGLRRDGANPTLLYGYGGFNVSETPEFSRSTVLWLERGGVYAVANLRGGGEYGEEWHRAGMRERKQNVFDDFIAAAEWLIRDRITRADRLAIYGGSNGGLLVGAALTQRPDLYRAVICAVPLLDMVRYHHFRIAKLWIPEYGSADHPDEFRWLHAYSPYHRVQDGVRYPAVLLTTAESDSRVDPMHARKMAARLQAAGAGGRPVLLRTETRAGHGAGKPVSKLVDEATDNWTFLFWLLGMEEGEGRRKAGG